MSHLLKALQSLETRGGPIAPPVGPAVQEAGNESTARTAQGASAAAEQPARIKPRPAPRVKPRRTTTQSPADPVVSRPLMETLAQTARVPPTKKLDETPAPITASAAQALHYTLAPAVVVN